MFQKIAKHRANDASNDVHRPPLSPAAQNFSLSWRNTQASRRVHLRQLWFCISANSLFLIEQVCIPIAAVWPQSKAEQTQVTISILTTMMRVTMVRMTMMTETLWWHWHLWSKEKSKALVQSGKSNRSQRSRVGTLDTSGFFWLCKSLAPEKREYYHGQCPRNIKAAIIANTKSKRNMLTC